MSVLKKDDTEILIKKTAKNLFFGEGRFSATTQEIADAAGVNRTLINYYFRSRDNLFNLVFQEALKEEREKSNFIMTSDMPFREKVERYIEDSLKVSLQYPYLEIYIVTRMNEGCHYENPDDLEMVFNLLDKQLRQEIERGNILPISTTQFIINLVSLVSFPSCMRPLLQKNLRLSDEDFDDVLKERKEIILKTLFKN